MSGQRTQLKFSYTQVWHKFEQNGIVVVSTEPILMEGNEIKSATISKEERHLMVYKYDGETMVLKITSKAKKVWLEEEDNEYTTELKAFIRHSDGSITTIDATINDYILQLAVNKVTKNEVILIGLEGSYILDLLNVLDRKKIRVKKLSEHTVIPVDCNYWLITDIFKLTWFALVHKPLLHNLPKTVLYRQLVIPFSNEYYDYGRLKKFERNGNVIEVMISYKGRMKTEKYTLALF